MGDLADEIEQMQAEINAFDDKLDQIDGTGEEGNKADVSPKKSIFSRLGSSGKVVRKSSTGDETPSGEEAGGGEEVTGKRRRASIKSEVIDKNSDRRRRESDITRDDINKAQIGNDAGKRRASRMFKNLLGTLRSFDETQKSESVNTKRAEIDKKVEERVAADRRKIIEEKRQLLVKKREKEKLLELLQDKKELAELREIWEIKAVEQAKYIRTACKPEIFWKPRIMDADTKELQKLSKEKTLELLDESRAKWDKQRDEMLEEIIEIKERNQFKDIDLQAHEKESPAERNGSKMSQRLVITKHARNDQRIVEPKIENGNSNRTIQKDAGDDESKKSTKELDRKQKERERRKEIENARKRRHKSDSESESSEEEEKDSRSSRKMKKVEIKEVVEKVTKDVRRFAPKDESVVKETNILPNPTRRISLKTTKKVELKVDDTKRRIAKTSEKLNISSETKGSSKTSSSSSDSSSENESCNRTPTKSG